MKKLRHLYILLLILFPVLVIGQGTTVKIAVMKYDGGGDWYSNPTSVPNLIAFCNENLKTNIDPQPGVVEPGSPEIFNYAYVDLTGHGNVVFSESDAANLRTYLESGGFLQISDNYGLDQFIRREMKKVFPELDFIELPFSHPIYSQKYQFPNGLPKIHEHDGKPAQGFGLIYKGRLVCFYNYECDLGDGWEDRSVHNDPEDVRQKALQMGANIISYVFNQ
ncbi:MAG TPA: DUF4159 domain-containing protein [Prolixibacteraceae bacterium]|nr:DUF4159 domain-containing protein [Prolixibacteraceae bacterium]